MNEYEFVDGMGAEVRNKALTDPENSQPQDGPVFLQQRMSSNYVFRGDPEAKLSDSLLRKIDGIIVQFPAPPSHQPQPQKEAPVVNATAAIKAVTSGFAGLRKGIFQGWG
jgi:hypothetical protein